MKDLLQKKQSSINNGIWFNIEDDGNMISIWGSVFTGQEKVYLNDALVSESRNYKLSNTHEFTDSAGARYSVLSKIQGYLSSQVECEVWKNGVLLRTMLAKVKFSAKKFFLRIGIVMLAGIVLGAIMGLSGIELNKWYVFIGIFILLLLVRRGWGISIEHA